MNDSEMKAHLDTYFKFKVGDFVKVAGSVPGELGVVSPFPILDTNGRKSLNGCIYIICERIIQECPGGLQKQYKLLETNAVGALGVVNNWILEIALEKSKSWKEMQQEEIDRFNLNKEE